jgi:hypothetical protein
MDRETDKEDNSVRTREVAQHSFLVACVVVKDLLLLPAYIILLFLKVDRKI